LGANSVVTKVGLEAELLIGLYCVYSLILELIRLELVQEPDAAPFLIEVNDHPPAFLGDHFHRRLELPTAIAPQRVEDIAGQTLRMHAYEHAGLRTDVAQHQRDVLVLVHIVPVAEYAPDSVVGRKPGLGDSVHEALGL